MRASEIFTLVWADVNTNDGLIFVKDAKHRDRFVPMTSIIKDMFVEMHRGQGDQLVFPGRKGNTIEQISKTFNKAIKATGLNEGITDRRQQIVFHSLRHSFASHLAIKGVPLLTVGRILGHATSKMTERYSHLSPKTFDDAVKAFEEGLKETATQSKEAVQ